MREKSIKILSPENAIDTCGTGGDMSGTLNISTCAAIIAASAGAIDAAYNEKQLSNYMKEEEVSIEVFIGAGKGYAKIWTCDLTHGYISINADYRS